MSEPIMVNDAVLHGEVDESILEESSPVGRSRNDAIAKGLTKFFDGKPCIRGHVSVEYVYGGCIDCRKCMAADRKEKYRQALIERVDISLRDKIVSRSEATALGLKNYFTGYPCGHGHVFPRETSSRQCISCQSEWEAARDKISKRSTTQKWARSERGRLLAKDHKKPNAAHRNLLSSACHVRTPAYWLWRYAKVRAIERGFQFDLNIEDIIVPDVCPILGIKLTPKIGTKGPSDSSPSLDRINNSEGYVRGNIEVVSHRANRLKSDALVEELEKIVTHLRKEH